jgi:ADP-ribose pyrophosphatase YjhB (NUDIX family)
MFITPATAHLLGRSIGKDVRSGAHAIDRLIDPTLGQPLARLRGNEQWGSRSMMFWYPGPNPAVDNVVTRTGARGGLEILLIKRGTADDVIEQGKWALPGGFHDTDARIGTPWRPGKENALQAAIRELREETGLDVAQRGTRVRHVGFYDRIGRNPEDSPAAWSVTNAFAIHLDGPLAQHPVRARNEVAAAKWTPVDELNDLDLAFDHRHIIGDALRR